MLFDLVAEITAKDRAFAIEFVNLGGGFGIPYKPEQTAIDWNELGQGIREVYETQARGPGAPPAAAVHGERTGDDGALRVAGEPVLHLKHTYKDFVGLDSCMANLMRPALYGAYHHITVMGKETAAADHVYDVTGSLCENNDKFAIDRALPGIDAGDIVVIHDTGAHGYAMGFNYNGKLRSAELLLKPDGTVQKIRRAETLDDYFSTVDFPSA